MTHAAIEIKSLNKTYKGNKRSPDKVALKDVDLTIPRGSIFGLLGPNGAGKSTLINIMAGLVMKTSGQVKIWDFDIDTDVRSAKSSIGIVPQEINYDAFFSPLALLDLMSGLYGVPKHKRRSMELLKLVGLEDKAYAYTRGLSGGMKRRLMVAKAMVHSPPVLVLDEPTAGVDVELRRQLWENVKDLSKRGVTILLTTHYLEEAEALCDEIAIINHGEIVVHENTEDLLGRIQNKKLRITLDREITEIPAGLDVLQTEKRGPNRLSVCYTPVEHDAGEILEVLRDAGFGIKDISTTESALEDVFLQLTQSIS